jgi:carbamate kinase
VVTPAKISVTGGEYTFEAKDAASSIKLGQNGIMKVGVAGIVNMAMDNASLGGSVDLLGKLVLQSGNALGNTPVEQERNIDHAVPALVDLITKGYEIIITHGNGPQVGMIQNAFAEGAKHSEKIPDVPLAECTAMSQGYIGFHLQKALRRELRARELPWHVASVVTQVAVDPTDPAFRHPTKPIGAYYTKEEAEKRSVHEKGAVYADDAGRGWRKVVPSPKPLRILEKESILHLLDHEFVVIACGGGGVPVVKTGFERYESVDAVIDKDFAAAKLAEEVNAKYLFNALVGIIFLLKLDFYREGLFGLEGRNFEPENAL